MHWVILGMPCIVNGTMHVLLAVLLKQIVLCAVHPMVDACLHLLA